jgi:hypothetical protein
MSPNLPNYWKYTRAHSKIHAPGRGEKISRDILEKVDRKIEIVNNGLL